MRFEILNYSKLFHRRNRFGRGLNFLKKLIKIWIRISSSSYKESHTRIGFPKKNDVFKQAIRALKVWIFSSMFVNKSICEKTEIFEQAFLATKLWNISIYLIDRIGSQKFTSKTELLSKKKIFKQTIGALKLRNISSYFINGVSSWKGWDF